MAASFEIANLSAWYGNRLAIENIYDAGVDPVSVRRAVGMVFQRPNPFPTMSIFDNTIAGFKLNGRKPKSELQDIVQRALTAAGLWDEVKDRLDAPATGL